MLCVDLVPLFPVCCSRSSSPTRALPCEPVISNLCPTATAVSHSQLQPALLIRVQHGSDALCKILLFSFCICLRQACKCFWSRKSQLWLQSSWHKLKTGRGREKGRRINEKHIRKTLLLLEMTGTIILFTCVLALFLYVQVFVLQLSKILAFPANSRSLRNEELPLASSPYAS